MKKKILFLDIDNTLMFKGKYKDSIQVEDEINSISSRSIELLKELHKEYYIVLATGRRLSNCERLKKYFPADYMIIEHGALIYNTKLDAEWAKMHEPSIGTLKQRKGILWNYENILKKSLVTASSGRYGSFRLDPKDNPGMTQSDLEKSVKNLPKELSYVRNNTFIDIMPKNATKILAMKYLVTKLKINWNDTFFVGDDYNDADALKEIFHAYTHSGATPAIIRLVKKRKGYISPYKSFDAINDILLRIKNYHN